MCPASLSSGCSSQVECPAPSSSPSNSCLALRLVLGTVSSKRQAAGLTSAPWTSPHLHCDTWPVGFQHDRDTADLFIFTSAPLSTVPGAEQAFRKYLLNYTELRMERNEGLSTPLCCWGDWVGYKECLLGRVRGMTEAVQGELSWGQYQSTRWWAPNWLRLISQVISEPYELSMLSHSLSTQTSFLFKIFQVCS